MSIEMARQTSIETIIASLKQFKRTGEKISEVVLEGKSVEALTLLTQEQRNISRIEKMLRQCEEGYLNPETAKRVMIARNQFKQERQKMARLFHATRMQTNRESAESTENAQTLQGFDYDVQSRLLREKQESLSQVHKKINSIHSVMRQTQEMTYHQGENLDLIGQNLTKAKDNTIESNRHLQEASKLQKSNNRWCIWLLIGVSAIICVIMLVLLLNCFIQASNDTSFDISATEMFIFLNIKIFISQFHEIINMYRAKDRNNGISQPPHSTRQQIRQL